jgi:hypothetical protein
MNRVYFVAGLFLMLFLTCAQFSAVRADDSAPACPELVPGPMSLTLGPDQLKEQRTEKVFNTLRGNIIDLTPDQQKAISAVLEDQTARIDALRLEYIDKVKAIRVETDQKIMKSLTSEQGVKYMDIKGRLWDLELKNPAKASGGGLKDEDKNKFSG